MRWRFEQNYYDHSTGLQLDPKLAVEARTAEMDWMEQMKVWEIVPIEECYARTGRAPIPIGWVDLNKGDADNPNIR